MNDIMTVTAAPRTIKIGDTEYLLYPLTMDDFGALQDWIDRQFPDPFDIVNRQIEAGRAIIDDDGKPAREPYSIKQQQFLYEIAAKQAVASRRLIGTDEASDIIRSPKGIIHLLTVGIGKGDPAFTEDKARELFGRLTLVDINRLFNGTSVDMVLTDPKAEPGMSPAGPTT